MRNNRKQDIEILVNQIASIQLPPFLSYLKKDSDNLFNAMNDNKIKIYKQNTSNNLLEVDVSLIQVPKYIFNKGAESIKYYSFKNDLSKRPMGIPNPVWFYCFVYNIIRSSESWLKELYHDEKNMQDFIHHSNSPILGRENILKFEYNDQEIVLKNYLSGISNGKSNSKAFKNNQEKTMKIEGTNPMYLKIDVESYFQNIYTHQFSKLSNQTPYNKIDNSDNKITDFFQFLDKYNMAVNDNHTKGILQGPISSAISAEFIGISLDCEVVSSGLNLPFVRYVDDFTFFSDEYSKLELQIENMDRILRKVGLSRKSEKTILEKGFSPNKSANLSEIFFRLPFLELKNSNYQMQKNDFLNIRSYLHVLINEMNIPQIRSLLTIINKFMIENYKLKSMSSGQSVFLVPMILKLAYSFPVITSHIYRLLDTLCEISEKSELHRIINIILDNSEYIESYYAETEIQIWHYYILSKYAKAKTRNKVLRKLFSKFKNDSHSTDPIILAFFINKNFSENFMIYEHVKNTYMYECGLDSKSSTNLQGIGSSRWWIVVVELYKYTIKKRNSISKTTKYRKEFNKISKKIESLFGTKTTPNYNELGIFLFIL
ncbi:RNA-directed DNA polymerase [Alkalibacterium sp. f15]|uniref:RNA-directed DNA polymerase n=1 Tax=Alkalibacterium sp. f15 TaxID=3414029 RepID=UPI003BF836D9